MASSKACYKLLTITILLLSFTFTSLAGNAENADVSECKAESGDPLCHNNKVAQKLKLIAIPSILVSSMIGVSLPLLTRSIPALGSDRDMFVIVKSLASGVILATGFMHVLPDSFNDLTSKCLPEEPWRVFPFSTFIAMVSVLLVLMIDSFAMSVYAKSTSKREGEVEPLENGTNSVDKQDEIQTLENGSNSVDKQDEIQTIENGSNSVDKQDEIQTLENGSNSVDKQDEIQTLENGSNFVEKQDKVNDDKTSQLVRNRVIAQMLELGIVVHSVVIGLAMGASDNQCTIRSLIAALCFHQLFEGMGLGGAILQAEFKSKTNWIMVFFFSVTTPFGIALGMAIQKIYDETSPTALIVVGVLNACSAGLLIYMALVDLLAPVFFGPKVQGNMKLMSLAHVAVFLGAGVMSLMAKWA